MKFKTNIRLRQIAALDAEDGAFFSIKREVDKRIQENKINRKRIKEELLGISEESIAEQLQQLVDKSKHTFGMHVDYSQIILDIKLLEEIKCN